MTTSFPVAHNFPPLALHNTNEYSGFLPVVMPASNVMPAAMFRPERVESEEVTDSLFTVRIATGFYPERKSAFTVLEEN